MKPHLYFLLCLCALAGCVDEKPVVSTPKSVTEPKRGSGEGEAENPEVERPDSEEPGQRPEAPEPEVERVSAKPEDSKKAPVIEPEASPEKREPKKPEFLISSETDERFFTRLSNISDRPIMLTNLTFHSIKEGRLPVKLFRDFPGTLDENERLVCGGEVFEKIETEAEKELVNPFSRDMRIAYEGDVYVITGMTLMPGQTISFGPYEKERFNRLDLRYVSLPKDTAFLRLAEDGERRAIEGLKPAPPGARSKKVFRLKFSFDAVEDVMTHESLRAIHWYEVANEDCGELDAAVPPPYRYGIRGEVFDTLREDEVIAALAE